MEVQSWMIRSWPSVEWYLPAGPDAWPRFSHVGTQVYDHLDTEGRWFGNTVWMGRVNGQTTGAAWEWTEFRHGVVVMTDPNTIVSNLQIRNTLGLSLTVGLNHIAHSLPWQDAVCRTIQALREQGQALLAPHDAPRRRRNSTPGRRRPEATMAG